MKKQVVVSIFVFIALVGAGVTHRALHASDHDDGENDRKARALNLTDHYVWKDTTDATKINFVQSSNPRSLPQQQYFFSTTAAYEVHVSRVTNKTLQPTGSDDMVFRWTFGVPSAANVQSVTFTVVKNGAVVGTDTSGLTTTWANSSIGTTTTNTVTVGGVTYTYFAGPRADSFFFDVERFFQVRQFAVDTFLNAKSPTLPVTCDDRALLAAGGDGVHLFNPPTCAPDFTKNYNVNAIVLQAPISALQASSETTFDTWSIITVPQ